MASEHPSKHVNDETHPTNLIFGHAARNICLVGKNKETSSDKTLVVDASIRRNWGT